MEGALIPVKSLHGHTSVVQELIFSKNMDELKIISTSSDETVRIWNADTGKQVGEPLLGHATETRGIAISTDGTKIVSGGNDGKIIMWNAETGAIIRVIKPRMSGANLHIDSLSFSPGDKTFASASFDGTCRIWNSETGELLHDFDDHQDMVDTVAYSPSGVKIASGSFDHTIRIRNTHTGERLTQPLLHADVVRAIVWSPDSRQLISACDDGQICFWSAPTGTQLGSPLQAHLDEINCMAISPSGSLLASASNDNTARLWNIVTRQPFGRVLHHGDEVATVAFSPNGQFVATGGRENIIFLWDISQEGVITTATVSVSLLHTAPIPHFAGDVDQPRSISDSLAGSPRPSIPAPDVPSDGTQGMSSLPIATADLIDPEVPPISSSSTLTRDALQDAGRVASPHGTVPVPASPSSQSFFKRLFSKSDTDVASAEHSKPHKSTFFYKLLHRKRGGTERRDNPDDAQTNSLLSQ
ncbi:WD40 repeat-like protein [Paxillus ammoniavirescens]|nr:WD40 repeat-like protein [Paxillus ammoniavirescens]